MKNRGKKEKDWKLGLYFNINVSCNVFPPRGALNQVFIPQGSQRDVSQNCIKVNFANKAESHSGLSVNKIEMLFFFDLKENALKAVDAVPRVFI